MIPNLKKKLKYWFGHSLLIFILNLLCTQYNLLISQCPSSGTIIITEIMQNPYAVSNANGEYFELYNTSNNPIDLNGFIIRDDDFDDDTIKTTLIIAAKDYIVMARNNDPMTNGGVSVDYQYSGFFLANSGDEIVLVCPDGIQIIDSVDYDDGPNFPIPVGASMQLNPNEMTNSGNDVGSNWCWSSTEFGDGDLGTPGASNNICGPCLPRYAQGNALIDTVLQNSIYETDGSIESSQVIGDLSHNPSVTYDSGSDITLMKGFEVTFGSVLQAFINGCGETMQFQSKAIDKH